VDLRGLPRITADQAEWVRRSSCRQMDRASSFLTN
jgi:hypothetical protein